ncbi:ribosome biogenesis ATPase RIX7 [Basidiobolus meristosporus CBS 931.73]|uniref:Ribosome biogenesis ATPase RIX7 n=1 Tax=Basidiobolus meristosporus CBS 931.73 TaxID=1314790 RepID=A0A1Y1YIW0_9FUNG|nr:ribosome biogenesis ATPase RIX7 [Basidiobolus meristosporus CBS 931.73]|eukprot:ORX97915.1 ribosome biogenesis ATPase RIX7 [Basidiobolus meristosporus CBS 931.73]
MGGNKGRKSKSSLSNDLERKTLRYIEEYQSINNLVLEAIDLYSAIEYLQSADFGMRRMKRNSLEKIVGNVLSHMKAAQESEPLPPADGEGEEGEDSKEDLSADSEFEDLKGIKTMEVKDGNAMNKSILNIWSQHMASSAPSSPRSEVSQTVESDKNTDPLQTPQTKKKRPRVSTDREVKRTKSMDKSEKHAPPTARLADLGGVESCIEEVLELVAMPLAHPEVYVHTGVQPPRGILLHGPPGCGKTLLANAIAGEMGVPFLTISAPSVVSGMSGESEKKIRDIFQEAAEIAPCILFIDEIDAITPKRENAQREMERRIVAQLLTCMDDLSLEKTNNKAVLIIGATNRPDSLDSALRRAGRFDREICLNVPDEEAREKILRVLSAKLRLSGDFDFPTLAKMTPGYVGADLNSLTCAAGMVAVKRIFKTMQSQMIQQSSVEHDDGTSMEMDIERPAEEMEAAGTNKPETEEALKQLRSISSFLATHPNPLTPEELEPLSINMDDFREALTKIQPSSKREGFATVPDVTWNDIGALQYVRDELRMAVVEPIKHPEFFVRVGINAPAGVLLWGPPGCGKTLLAKAVANESHTNFISVKGPELLNKYVGESERAVRQVFARARASSPCVVFFDELDALCARRDDSQSEASARVVNTLLTELDGVENRAQVFVIAATNRPDIIDPAMLRPGRLDKLLYVELPTPEERCEILKTLAKKTPLDGSVHFEEIAQDARCEGFSGADLASLVRESAVAALRSTFYAGGTFAPTEAAEEIRVGKHHFEIAFSKAAPSVSKSDKRQYDALRKRFGCEKPVPEVATHPDTPVS